MKTELKIGYICYEKLTKFVVVVTAIDEINEIVFCMFCDGSTASISFKEFENDYKFTGNTCQKELLDIISRITEVERDKN